MIAILSKCYVLSQKMTALMVASQSGLFEVVMTLLKAKADVNLTNTVIHKIYVGAL